VTGIYINYPKPDNAYFEEECGEYVQLQGATLFPLSQYKFRDPCKCDKCLVRMACTKYCEDKIGHMKWVGYKKTIYNKFNRWKSRQDFFEATMLSIVGTVVLTAIVLLIIVLSGLGYQ
jgi:hypothetical protein